MDLIDQQNYDSSGSFDDEIITTSSLSPNSEDSLIVEARQLLFPNSKMRDREV